MTKNTKISENKLLIMLKEREYLLKPLKIDRVDLEVPNAKSRLLDAVVFAESQEGGEVFRFAVEAKGRSTPNILQSAVTQIRNNLSPGEYPLVYVPYLSSERLEYLEAEQVSGIDLCGNGIITIPNRLMVYRTGNPNRYPESRSLSNPFQGKSAMIARMFISTPQFSSLDELRDCVQKLGVSISLSQVSKAVAALTEELLISRVKRSIFVRDPDAILERLSQEWSPDIEQRVHLKLPGGISALNQLNTDSRLTWSITGASTAGRYVVFPQGGPVQVAVSDSRKAMTLLEAKEESVPSFSDVELIKTNEPGFYYDNEKDDEGLRWASRLQTWIELDNGDGRQRDAARDVRNTILPEKRL